ncbi:MAG: XdhC family protein [Sulfolobaceae archaeon]
MSSCEVFSVISKLGSEGKRFAIITLVRKNGRVERTVYSEGKLLLGVLPKEILELAESALNEYRRIEKEFEIGKVIIEPVEPRPSVIIVGSGTIAKALAKIASALGYYVAVVGNNDIKEEEFINYTSFISNSVEILEQIVNETSFVVVANEGGKPYDGYATYLALKGGARYVGVLASAKRGALIIAEVLKRGLKLEEIKDRLYTPAGIDIGSKTAEEIALSILAEIVSILRGGSKRNMREVKDPYPYLKDALEGKIDGQCFFIPKVMSEQI